jgi:xanthine dehydrogenase YagT iron-sulfur-binding subunit
VSRSFGGPSANSWGSGGPQQSRLRKEREVDAEVTLKVDGTDYRFVVDTRTTLLDALRERLGITSPKKGCDHGQCGACTILLDGRRANSCLALAVAYDGSEIITAEGLAENGELHPMQRAFIEHDGYQCGYCTPGQIVSAVGMLEEVGAGWPSHVTGDLNVEEVVLDDDEIRERMSGNLCRCAAYANIVPAIREVSGR